MKAAVSLAMLLSAGLQTLHADVRSDLLDLTGGREVRAVWLRFPWCDSNYTPIKTYSDIDGNSRSKHNQVAVFGTGESRGIRILDNGAIAYHTPGEVFITRKDGSHVVWSDMTTKTAWIQAFDGATPPVNLNLGTDYLVYALHYNPATGEENLFVVPTNKRVIYRIPLTSDFTADLSRKTQVVDGSWAGGHTDDGFSVDEAISVSGDGRMCGGAFPWPTTMILDMVNKQAHVRHAGTFGCNANIAPDNSYRFFHFMDSHDGLYLFAANLGFTYTTVPINRNLPGVTRTGYMDNNMPRFTSDVQFMTAVYPGPYTSLTSPPHSTNHFNLTAAQVKALPPDTVAHFCLGKFSADFTSVQKWALIAGGDVRFMEDGGMAWIGPASAEAQRRPASLRVTRHTRAQPLCNLRGQAVGRTPARGICIVAARGTGMKRIALIDVRGAE